MATQYFPNFARATCNLCKLHWAILISIQYNTFYSEQKVPTSLLYLS